MIALPRLRRATGLSFSYSPLFGGRISAALYPEAALPALSIANARLGLGGVSGASCRIVSVLRPASISQSQLSGCQWVYDSKYKLVVYAEADGRCVSSRPHPLSAS